MELFKPAWLSKDPKKASKAFEKITDQDKLVRAAQEAPYYGVRQHAVEKLTDQIILAMVSKTDPNDYVRKTAVKRLYDQSTLGYVAKNDEKFEIRAMAAEKLTDPVHACEMFDEMMKYNLGYQFIDEIEHKMIERVNEITDQKVLVNIAENYRCFAARQVAIEKLTDQNVLTDIAKNYRCEFQFRLQATEKLIDKSLAQEIFIDIAEKASNYPLIRFKVAQNINNNDISQKIYLSIFNKEYEKRSFNFGIQAAYLMKDKRQVIDKFVKILQSKPVPRRDRVLMFDGFDFDVTDKFVKFLKDSETEKQIENREEVCATIRSYNDIYDAWIKKENYIIDY